MIVESFRNLIVWQKSMDLVVLVYHLTENFPKNELYGLVSQMRRAAVSIPYNISEGRMRGTRKDYRHFLLNAYGSGAELETQIEISKRIFFDKKLDFTKMENILVEVMKILNVMIKNLKIIKPKSYKL